MGCSLCLSPSCDKIIPVLMRLLLAVVRLQVVVFTIFFRSSCSNEIMSGCIAITFEGSPTADNRRHSLYKVLSCGGSETDHVFCCMVLFCMVCLFQE